MQEGSLGVLAQSPDGEGPFVAVPNDPGPWIVVIAVDPGLVAVTMPSDAVFTVVGKPDPDASNGTETGGFP